MARIRTIKPDFFTDSKTGTLTGNAKTLFIGLLIHADDYGVIKWDLEEFKVKILPYIAGEAEAVLTPLLRDELLKRGLVQYFGYSDKEEGSLVPYLWITNFKKHQRIDKPGAPIIANWKADDTLESFTNREHSENVPRTFQEHSENILTGKERSGEEKERSGKGKESPPLTPQRGGHTNTDNPVLFREKEVEEVVVVKKSEKIPYEEIIADLNLKAGTHYRHTTQDYRKRIRDKWKQGFRLEDFRQVHSNQCSKLLGTEKAVYINPLTLYGKWFESFLNAPKTDNTFSEATRKTMAAGKAWLEEESQSQQPEIGV